MYVASTRFTNQTIQENREYKEKWGLSGVIYSTNIRIREKYTGELIYVVEMNNETNKIEGIGIIRNKLVLDKSYNIYSTSDYNRFVYMGKYYLDRKYLLEEGGYLVEMFETILFKGKSHSKRLSGISIITDKTFVRKERTSMEIRRLLSMLFKSAFAKNSIITIDINS